MKLHDTQITNYLTFCKSQKCLDVKTIRAYKIDLKHFSSSMPSEDSFYNTSFPADRILYRTPALHI